VSAKCKNVVKTNVPKRMVHDFSRKTPFGRSTINFSKIKLSKVLPKRKASSLSIQLDRAANNIPRSALIGAAILSGFGIAALATYGATQSPTAAESDFFSTMYGIKVKQEEATKGYSKELREKIGKAYGYFAGSLALTAVSAVVASRSPLAYRMHANPWLFLGVGAIGTLAAMIATQSISYHQSPVLKHLAWGAFIGLEGLCLAPVTVLGGPLIMNAVIGTGCIVGAISILTAAAPSEAWRQYSGIYGIGLGVLMGSSLGLLFFPGSNILYNLVLYGGLAIHGWGVFRSTGRIIDHSNRIPVKKFDPINESIGLYVHTLGIFVRMVMMLSNGNRRK